MMANAGHRAFDTRIFHKEARSLAKAGFDVTLVIPHTEDFTQDGVKVLSVPVHRKGIKKLTTSPWLVYIRALKCPRDAFFHLHDSELLWTGLLLKLSGRKVVYDAHEDTPRQISYQHWIPGWLKKPYACVYFLLEKICGWWFDGIIVSEPVIAPYFPPSKTILIRNFPILEQFPLPAKPYSSRSRKVVYAGLLSRPRGAVEMAKAALLVSKKTDFSMVFAGDFSPASLRDEIDGKYPVELISWMDFASLVNLMQDARAGIITPHPILRYLTNYPIKLFEYMCAGLPVIASRSGESAAFVKEADCGWVVDPLNPQEIADAIEWILQHPVEAGEMGMRGRKMASERWNWETEAKSLIGFYNRLFEKR